MRNIFAKLECSCFIDKVHLYYYSFYSVLHKSTLFHFSEKRHQKLYVADMLHLVFVQLSSIQWVVITLFLFIL